VRSVIQIDMYARISDKLNYARRSAALTVVDVATLHFSPPIARETKGRSLLVR